MIELEASRRSVILSLRECALVSTKIVLVVYPFDRVVLRVLLWCSFSNLWCLLAKKQSGQRAGRRGLAMLEDTQEQYEEEAVEWPSKCNRQAGGFMPMGVSDY